LRNDNAPVGTGVNQTNTASTSNPHETFRPAQAEIEIRASGFVIPHSDFVIHRRSA